MEKAKSILPSTSLMSSDISARNYVMKLHRKADLGENDVVVFAMTRYSLGANANNKVITSLCLTCAQEALEVNLFSMFLIMYV